MYLEARHTKLVPYNTIRPFEFVEIQFSHFLIRYDHFCRKLPWPWLIFTSITSLIIKPCQSKHPHIMFLAAANDTSWARNWNDLSIELLLSAAEPLIGPFSRAWIYFVTFAGRREYFVQIVETVAYRLDNSGM
jgi:hypothetical protein